MANFGVVIGMIRSLLKNFDSDTLNSHQVTQLLDEPVGRIREMVLIAEEKSHYSDDDVIVDGWFRKVANTICEADDLVDEIATTALAASSSSKSKVKVHLRFSLLHTPVIGLSRGAAPQIKRLRKELDELAEAGKRLGFDVPSGPGPGPGPGLGFDVPSHPGPGPGPGPSPSEREHAPSHTYVPIIGTETHDSFPLDEGIVGRAEDKERIVDLLLDTSGSINQDISVVAIVGMTGIGKTTLAKMAYNDARVNAYFDLRVWIVLPLNGDMETIIRGILQAGGRSKFNNLSMDQLIHHLRREIDGKIFLLVLLDVWMDDPIRRLLDLLNGGSRGSKILVTTRSLGVARRIASVCPYELRGLSDDSSWSLFKKLAFGEREPEEKLVEVGIEILKQCGSLPLPIILIAKHLHGRSEEHFLTALSIVSSPTDSTNVRLRDVLMLSYKHLQPEIQPCFAYCSLFPQDFEFNILDMVSLWMAQGFLEPDFRNQLDLEDIGEEYFQKLVESAFFLDVTRDESDEAVSWRIHDFIHDLAKFISRDSCIVKNHGLSEVRDTVRHLSLVQGGDASQLEGGFLLDGGKLQNLRTFLWFISQEYNNRRIGLDRVRRDKDLVASVNISNFKSVRVLDLHAFGIKTLADSIGELIHLRYLDLSDNKSLVKLPNSIAKLYNLQTLKLSCCVELKELPRTMGKLIHLRRLEIDGCDSLSFMPPGFENMSSLRILPRYIVGSPHSESSKASCRLKALGNMNHLRGRLTIELSKYWTTVVKESTESNLSKKSKLVELGIRWQPTRNSKVVDSLQYQQVLEGLQPHPNLKLLWIEGYRGPDFPSWAKGDRLASALPNLVVVSIEGCGGCKTLPPFSRLQFLKRLTLRFMDEVQFVEEEEETDQQPSLFFPSLEELTLHSFYSLQRWWREGQVLESKAASLSFPRLLKLNLWSCPKLKSMPLFPSVEVLDLQNINKDLLDAPAKRVTRVEPESSSSSSSNSLPSGHSPNLPRLQRLQIKGCPNLKTLPPFGMNSCKLEKLVVERLDELSSLAEGLQKLTSLKKLEIASCKDLDLSDREHETWKFLSELQHLTLRGIPKLSTLPEGLRHVCKLKYLCISACNSLSCLPEWISTFTSLQHLRLEGCPALTMLSEGLKDVRSLLKVDIIECAQLLERCKQGGQDWHKIRHARILLHKSWRYALMSEGESSSLKPQNHGDNVVVHVNDPTIHVAVTVSRPR